LKNSDFFNEFARTGAIGLVGGTHFIDKGIKKAQKKITADKQESLFSHVFIFSDKRADERWWVIESDLEFHSGHIRLGVQENRVDKYFNEDQFPNVAILDLKLNPQQSQTIVKEALDVLANRAEYSLSEIMGVLFSFKLKGGRKQENKFRQENAFICSSFVQHCYGKIGLDLNPIVSSKNITPEDIYATPLPHELQIIKREFTHS
jgi:hypothetical protein